MTTFDFITEVTHHARPASDYEVECALKAFGFESSAHLTDVLAGRRPSALAEPSIWRTRAAAAVPTPAQEIEVGQWVRCWNSKRGRYEVGTVIGFDQEGRVSVRRASDGHVCRYGRAHVALEGGVR